jgi:hypothetical protein
MKQQIDPIAQAMQILQFVTQRRGQQADIDQGQQRLDLTRQGMQMDRQRGRQQNRQFQQGMDWDRERALMQQKQFEDSQSRAMLEAAQRGVADERKFGAEELHRKQMLEKIQQQTEAQKLEGLMQLLPGMQDQALMYKDRPELLQPIQQEIQQIMQRIKDFYGLQPVPQAPVDPKTAQLNAQFLTQ